MASNSHVINLVCPKSNSSKILWFSLLPASLMTIRSKMKLLSSEPHFPKFMRPSRTGNSLMPIVKSSPKSSCVLVRDFMPVLITCKFDEDPIKNEVASFRTTFSPLHVYRRLKGK